MPRLPPDQLIREIRDGLAVDGRPVPLAHRLEIRGALAVGRASLEAGDMQQVGGGGEHIGDAVAQVDMAVAVEIDAVFDVGRRQKLRLADFAGEGADHVAQGQIAALHDLQRRQQLALEQFGAAAIMRHGRERADHRHLADVALAEIGLQPPDRDHDLRRHAEARLDARQQRGVTLQHLPAHLDPPRPDPGRDILLEGLVEGAALAPVEIQYRRILRHAGKRLRNHRRRNPRRLRLRRHARHEAVEVAAAARGEGGGGEGKSYQKSKKAKSGHDDSLLRRVT